MNKRLAIILGICIISTNIVPVSAFAIGGSLPKISTPKLSPLETPKLSTDYNTELNKLKDSGWGQYQYDPTQPLPTPTVEAPSGTGTSAFDVFKSKYGDMWNDPSRKLVTPNNIPDDTFFAAVKDFASKNQDTLNKEKNNDSTVIAGLLKQKLDTSNQWDLSAVKSSSISASQQQAFLNSTTKPAGWGATKSVPSASSWFSSAPKAAGYSNGDMVKSALNVVEGTPSSVINTGKAIVNDAKTALGTAWDGFKKILPKAP